MDDRQSGIKEGAGLEDSRVNQEFLDFLNKWSSPVLLTLAVAALIWAGLQYLERKKVARIDQAFSELASATQGGNPSPASLKTIAAEYKGVRSVSELALLTTTDLYLNAFVIGYEPGAEMDPVTGLPNESDILDDAQRQVYLEQAGQLAGQVLELTDGVEGKELIEMQAMSRLAAVDEGKRDFDAANSMYQRLEALAIETQYSAIATFAQQRMVNLELLKEITPLPSQDDFVPLPGEENSTLTQEQIQELLNSIPSAESDPLSDSETESENEPESVPDTDPVADPSSESDSP
jgi:hypothetical protein